MENLEYLKGVKASDDVWHTNKNIGYREITREKYYEYRKVKALEIIAEQIINLDNTLAVVVNTLENIETAIKQG